MVDRLVGWRGQRPRIRRHEVTVVVSYRKWMSALAVALEYPFPVSEWSVLATSSVLGLQPGRHAIGGELA